jgi:hypothetical protein
MLQCNKGARTLKTRGALMLAYSPRSGRAFLRGVPGILVALEGVVLKIKPKTRPTASHAAHAAQAPAAAPSRSWRDVANQTGEMMRASASVIGHRTGRMARAGVHPSPLDQREFSLMGQEKLDAASESLLAMQVHLGQTSLELGLEALRRIAAGMEDLWSLAGSTSLGELRSRHARLMHTLGQSFVFDGALNDCGAALVAVGLEPIHARALANAKRLAAHAD